MSKPFFEQVPTRSANPSELDIAAGHADRDISISVISVISEHSFELEMLAQLLAHAFDGVDIRRFHSIAEWQGASPLNPAQETILYNIGAGPISSREVKAALRAVIVAAGERRVIVMSRDDDLMATCEAIDCGASSYIPPSVGVDELIAALRGASRKSVVLPRDTMLALCAALFEAKRRRSGLDRVFTDRQLAVAQALRRGAANKTIAYELGLCESTVKVHVRNIMRKLKATNRTQAASRLNDLANGSGDLELSDE